ncbi:hypothetical protein PPL_02292 [Heterostelium album PN500]|uniref:Uncharacterized protein n=1 Tax=Heterostelium pallidum (strain ATCC 26659 / Pp 5 / PN500) TaxID=670386 RepID=D3B1W7_HETP5|nr:hypothetical protein PPL_02292 [Heterostelium album PN500]EFA85291.1 hypothetical protein PPL_02292 [Heterostelium album PN500]|eukprot:XP_020437400.1 hypothetical protein PPL_02292 [Heterostelium album PN500]
MSDSDFYSETDSEYVSESDSETNSESDSETNSESNPPPPTTCGTRHHSLFVGQNEEPSNRPTRCKNCLTLASFLSTHKHLDKSSLCSTSYHSIITDSPSTSTNNNDICEFCQSFQTYFVKKFNTEPPIQNNNNLPPTIHSSSNALKYQIFQDLLRQRNTNQLNLFENKFSNILKNSSISHVLRDLNEQSSIITNHQLTLFGISPHEFQNHQLIENLIKDLSTTKSAQLNTTQYLSILSDLYNSPDIIISNNILLSYKVNSDKIKKRKHEDEDDTNKNNNNKNNNNNNNNEFIDNNKNKINIIESKIKTRELNLRLMLIGLPIIRLHPLTNDKHIIDYYKYIKLNNVIIDYNYICNNFIYIINKHSSSSLSLSSTTTTTTTTQDLNLINNYIFNNIEKKDISANNVAYFKPKRSHQEFGHPIPGSHLSSKFVLLSEEVVKQINKHGNKYCLEDRFIDRIRKIYPGLSSNHLWNNFHHKRQDSDPNPPESSVVTIDSLLQIANKHSISLPKPTTREITSFKANRLCPHHLSSSDKCTKDCQSVYGDYQWNFNMFINGITDNFDEFKKVLPSYRSTFTDTLNMGTLPESHLSTKVNFSNRSPTLPTNTFDLDKQQHVPHQLTNVPAVHSCDSNFMPINVKDHFDILVMTSDPISQRHLAFNKTENDICQTFKSLFINFGIPMNVKPKSPPTKKTTSSTKPSKGKKPERKFKKKNKSKTVKQQIKCPTKSLGFTDTYPRANRRLVPLETEDSVDSILMCLPHPAYKSYDKWSKEAMEFSQCFLAKKGSPIDIDSIHARMSLRPSVKGIYRPSWMTRKIGDTSIYLADYAGPEFRSNGDTLSITRAVARPFNPAVSKDKLYLPYQMPGSKREKQHVEDFRSISDTDPTCYSVDPGRSSHVSCSSHGLVRRASVNQYYSWRTNPLARLDYFNLNWSIFVEYIAFKMDPRHKYLRRINYRFGQIAKSKLVKQLIPTPASHMSGGLVFLGASEFRHNSKGHRSFISTKGLKKLLEQHQYRVVMVNEYCTSRVYHGTYLREEKNLMVAINDQCEHESLPKVEPTKWPPDNIPPVPPTNQPSTVFEKVRADYAELVEFGSDLNSQGSKQEKLLNYDYYSHYSIYSTELNLKKTQVPTRDWKRVLAKDGFLFNRDVNAARNILYLGLFMSLYSFRPKVFMSVRKYTV